MEKLKYIVEDKTLAEILGIQNFNNDESAILELVKNAYDANAEEVVISFKNDSITIEDNGIGMNESDIKKLWMHVGESDKGYLTKDYNDKDRVLAGSKGIGRFALARLGRIVLLTSKKYGSDGIVWSTDWDSSTLKINKSINEKGTIILIENLREKWTKNKIKNLIDFLSKTYNDNLMRIKVISNDFEEYIEPSLNRLSLGINCLTSIKLIYDSCCCKLRTIIESDEFKDEAQQFVDNKNIHNEVIITDIAEELYKRTEIDNSSDLRHILQDIGDFTADLYFYVKPIKADMEKFLYKHSNLPEIFPSGIVLYRNAFSISSYEGKKDWLGLGRRMRKSPAAASHPTGSWRVRENQISGKILIDKERNKYLEDLSNRQALDENKYYQLFIEIILTGISEFERYRQYLIRNIVKNNPFNKIEFSSTPNIDKILNNTKSIDDLTQTEKTLLISELKLAQKENFGIKREKSEIENRYRYDVRILNVLATIGLKASSIAHEMKNDRNAIKADPDYVIKALKRYDMWTKLSLPENTSNIYRNVPLLLSKIKEKTKKILIFMNNMLSDIEKQQFIVKNQMINDLLDKIKFEWERDYAFVDIKINIKSNIYFNISEDSLKVILDNLILNTLQQNDGLDIISIEIIVNKLDNKLYFIYKDNGCGLAKKYLNNPYKILEVHETTRKNGHGLGMWIVNNTITMLGGKILDINGIFGFQIEFLIGEQNNGKN